MIKKGSDGIPYLDVDTEKMASRVNKVYDFLYNNGSVYIGRSEEVGMFKNDRIYLTAAYLGFTQGAFRDMETNFTILPYPKYDENQEKYGTRVQDGHTLISIPVNSDKTEMLGAFLEAMASESYKNVTPVYWEVATKIKYARDEDSGKMLDIIRSGIDLKFAQIYNESIGNPWFVMRDLMPAKSNNFASWYEKNEPRIIKALDKFVTQMLEAE
jgi:hypothetical protein